MSPAITSQREEQGIGRDACVVGEIREEPAGVVALRNAFGRTRIVDMLVGTGVS